MDDSLWSKDWFISELYYARFMSWFEVEQIVELAKYFLTSQEVNEVLCEVDELVDELNGEL